ncbi:hypothetical protein BpHYR1_021688 [Brachionus plicatilis]|uniref:Uncharacterized protein n=1 Tax=Brachionus plicatilis TaxID=10195 RepID=A0A3M7RUN9_BRAPC|nr:hypothetical protein BpHYR1_021688 [Brachionus plicatilis]
MNKSKKSIKEKEDFYSPIRIRNKLVRSVPLFPVVTWNVHNRVVKNLAREQHVTEISFEQIKSGFVLEKEKNL